MVSQSAASRLVDARLGNTPKYYLAPQEDLGMRISDEVRQCAVFVGLPHILDDGQQILAFIGTAFAVSVPSSNVGRQFIYLVTAKHVAERLADRPFLVRANTLEGGSILLSGEGARWCTHPTDSSVDVAVASWIPRKELEVKTVPTSMFLTDAVIKEKNIGVGDEVFITGLFAHLSGSKKNLPIVRMGNLAMMPSEPVHTRLGDIEAYLIEARSIGGLSGSPVFVIASLFGPTYLLGLMHGHWDIAPDLKNDAVLMDDDTLGKVNMGIAIVIPAKKILEVLQHPELIEMRRTVNDAEREAHVPTPD